MQKNIIKFAVSLMASIGVMGVGAMGVAGASSISNTGPGSTNVIYGSGGSISNTGPGSANVIGGGCHQGCNGCGSSCEQKNEDCPPPPPKEKDCPPKQPKEKDCPPKQNPKPIKHHTKWCWKWCGHGWKYCQVQS